MSKKKKKSETTAYNKVKEIMPISDYSILRYTWDAWKRCYPESGRQDWEERTWPENYITFIDETANIDALINDGIKVKVVTLDEEYFEWLGDKENTSAKRLEYMGTIDESNATRLMKKNDLDIETSIRFVILSTVRRHFPFKSEEYFKLPSDVKEALKKEIEKITRGEVFIPSLLIQPDAIFGKGEEYLENRLDEIEDYIYACVKGGPFNPKVPKGMDKQIYKNETMLDFLCVPVLVRSKVSSAQIDFGNIPKDIEEIMCPEDHLFGTFPDITNGKMLDDKTHILALPHLLLYNEIPAIIIEEINFINGIAEEESEHARRNMAAAAKNIKKGGRR